MSLLCAQDEEDADERIERARAVVEEVMEEDRPQLDVELEQVDEADGGD